MERVSILSITSVLLVLQHKNAIIRTLNRGVRFDFLILDPEDNSSVESQKRNYPGKDIKGQIQETLSELKKIKVGLRENLKRNLSIRLYRDMNIEEGILIAKRKKEQDSWLKVETVVVGGDSNSRLNRTAYYRSNEDFFKQYEHKYKDIWNSETTKEVLKAIPK